MWPLDEYEFQASSAYQSGFCVEKPLHHWDSLSQKELWQMIVLL